MPEIIQILTSPSPTEPMRSRDSVRAVPDKGLEGDRYFEGKGTFSPHPQRPDFEVTLVEAETVAHFAETSGLPFTTLLARRNLVTRGVALNELVGRDVAVGSVRLRFVRLCEPCQYLAKQTWPQVLRGLVHRGGIRAQILTDGIICVGDAIGIEPLPAP